MCVTCGCEHHHDDSDHEVMHARGISHSHEEHKIIEVEKDILSRNAAMAERNRGYFEARNCCCLNLMSSPGSGKTTLLEDTIKRLGHRVPVAVIEGDQQTSNDADRIASAGAPVFQVNTLSGCHLDADMVHHALHHLEPAQNSVLFIENVGNLVCPAMFDLGEKWRIVVISVTEGDDKPLKYPYMFENASVCVINKIDLLPYLKSDVGQIKENAMKVNPGLRFFEVSATQGTGMEAWCDFLLEQIRK